MGELNLTHLDEAGAPDADVLAGGASALPDLNQSAVDRFRAERERMDDGTETFDLPNYENVQMRVRRLKPGEIGKLRGDAETEDDFNEALLVDACEEILVKVDGKAEPFGTPPVRFDRRLAAGLGHKVDAPESLVGREVLRFVMRSDDAEEHNANAINALAAVVYAWMVFGSFKDEPGKA